MEKLSGNAGYTEILLLTSVYIDYNICIYKRGGADKYEGCG